MVTSLTSALGNAGNALDVIQNALSVIQANVSNSSTPGYATQQLNLETAPMDSVSGMGGGVMSGGGRELLARVRRVAKAGSYPQAYRRCRIVAGSLGEDAGALGAAELALDAVKR